MAVSCTVGTNGTSTAAGNGGNGFLPTSLELPLTMLVVVEEEEKQYLLWVLVALVVVEMENMVAEMLVDLEHSQQEEAVALLVNKADILIHQDLHYQQNGGSGIVVIRYELDESSGTAKATGGEISFYGGKTIHTFRSTGVFDNTTASPLSIEYVCVAGGGSGGAKDNGGGGGAGGYLTGTTTCPTSPVTVTIGAGGVQALGNYNGTQGGPGGLSGAVTVSVTGGGAGPGSGGPGGSGGGGTFPGGSGGSGGTRKCWWRWY